MDRDHSTSPAQRRHVGWRGGLGLIAAVAAVTLAAGALPALAGGGTVGEPQPELAPFHPGATGGGGSGAVLPDGNLVLASPTRSATSITVCLLHPGSRACVSSVALRAYAGGGNQDSFYGAPQVLATGGHDVTIVAEDCCYIGAGDGDGVVVFDSTNDGKTFGAETQAGNLAGVNSAAYVDGSILVGNAEAGGDTDVQAISPNPSVPQTSTATLASSYDYDTSVTNYGSGVLVASDNSTNAQVWYDRTGAALNSTGSYVHVATFAKETVIGISGSALLTLPASSGLTGAARLRIFNGTSFGPPEKVPVSSGDVGYWSVQKAGSLVHVFYEDRRNGYDAYTETSPNGAHWTPLEHFGSAIRSTSLSPVLGPTGAGLLFESAGTPLTAQPILYSQGVHVAFVPPRVKAGHVGVLRGGGDPAFTKGLDVTLERLHAGRWYPVKVIHVNTASFTFHVPGVTETYRVVIANVPGYYEYGYSRAVTLTAVP